jgi:hypothetical protein
MATRAKFHLYSKTEYSGNNGQTAVTFQAVTSGSPENDSFFKWTPSGKLEMTIRKEVADQFEVGKEYYLDFSPAFVTEAASEA